jgi:hypothetical protein
MTDQNQQNPEIDKPKTGPLEAIAWTASPLDQVAEPK